MANWVPLWLHRLGSPPVFYRFAGAVRPWAFGLALLLGAIALYGGLVLAPADYQQGDAYRIIFIHVPSAWMSLFIYGAMAVAAFVGLVWRIKIAEVVAMESAPVGAAFTLITLVTGSLWGKPMWGTWWTWDARLTSELVLLFIYLGIIGLYHSFEDRRQGARAASFLVLVGAVNVPIVHFSVNWWNTLHQGSTIRLLGPSHIEASMVWPLLTMMAATKCYYVASLFARVRADLIASEGGKAWVRDIALGQPGNDAGMSQFFAMGGYGSYVWPAFAAFFIVLLIDTLAPLARRRRNLRELRARLARQENRRRPGTPPSNESNA